MVLLLSTPMYANTAQMLGLDDALSGVNTGGGLTASYGAFNNDKDMAVNLGFKSFSRGGYTFHKHSWKLLNDPTLLGTYCNGWFCCFGRDDSNRKRC